MTQMQPALMKDQKKVKKCYNQNNGMYSSSSPSLENLFSFNVDDLFNDSDLEICPTTPEVSNNVRIAGKSTSAEMPSSATNEGSVSQSFSVEKPSVTNFVSSGTTEAQFSDKEWSMGRGIVDKQGNPVQERSRLSLSSKKIKKVPEITNQPLINKVMSPNPMQRKLLYKKTEIPFSLSDLKELAKRKKELRSVEDSNLDHLIGRLDPWGVWLLRRGTDLVCVNQYRIVGGPDCWSTLCNMSSKCEPTRHNKSLSLSPVARTLKIVKYPNICRYLPKLRVYIWIDDERLTANGFDVCLKTDAESGATKVELYKMSTSIPFYGVPDLAEVLELVCQKDKSDWQVTDSDSLSSCRPFKVIHYLQGEAVRVARTLSFPMSRTEVSEILSRMEKQITEDARTCVHGRPFL
ncbi:ATP-binding mismatch repair protein [Desmophyllum pertusum]|uniref:ATP-binding mismatch repair protein n=1 Tax=Desmophyllum pertusum TaxID=174260 RepID=A0A9W9ZE57_9CNID|nr:ATP-binding mismatch repair protein [Desmophyllum pertusum]